jgi:hypothetical protein
VTEEQRDSLNRSENYLKKAAPPIKPLPGDFLLTLPTKVNRFIAV